MIRDQIIIGTADNSIRKAALEEQWSLADLQSKGRKIEAAAYGAAQIKKEAGGGKKDRFEDTNVQRITPGKYSRKGGNGRKPPHQKCRNCSNKACHGGDQCFAKGRECFDCGGQDHFKGADNCKKKGKKEKKRRKAYLAKMRWRWERCSPWRWEGRSRI